MQEMVSAVTPSFELWPSPLAATAVPVEKGRAGDGLLHLQREHCQRVVQEMLSDTDPALRKKKISLVIFSHHTCVQFESFWTLMTMVLPGPLPH